MNFEEMQTIWDTQKNKRLYAIDEAALRRLVEKQAFAINRDLKWLELVAIAVLVVLGVTVLIDTFFNGDEYFQLVSVAIEFAAAGFLWMRRRKRESDLGAEPASLIDHIETAMKRTQATIGRGRDLTIFFSLFILYGTGIRIAIYGWGGSEMKLAVSVICVILVIATFRFNERQTHTPRLRSFEALRTKLLGDDNITVTD